MGKPTDKYLIEFELVSSNGKRSIDTRPVILGYQQDIARSVMADFIMLGSGDKGSFALSKSKTDLFLSSLEVYINAIKGVLNNDFLPKLWGLNAFDKDYMPTIEAGRVAPVNLDELGRFVRNVTAANILLDDEQTQNIIRSSAGFPQTVTEQVSDDVDIPEGGQDGEQELD
jgi:hypothetical protein